VWRLQIALMKGRRPLNRHRGDLNRRSFRPKRILFEVLHSYHKNQSYQKVFPKTRVMIKFSQKSELS
jgi:hypothetical protein